MNGDVFAMEVGRRLVTQLAPDELPLFDQTWRALGGYPRWRSRHREERLGFGLPDAGMVLITAVVSGVLIAVINELGKDFGTWSGRMLVRLRLRRAQPLPDPLPPLAPLQLRRIHELAQSTALHFGLPENQADALARMLISELSMSEHER